MVVLLSLLAGAGALSGCQKGSVDKAKQAAGGPDGNSVRQSLEGLKPKLGAQDTRFAALRKQVEAIPYDLPGFGEVRAKFYATEEGRGIMGVKLTWLSERLDAAMKSGRREELEKVSKDVEKTHDEMRQIDQLGLEFIHQLPMFERRAAMLVEHAASGASTVTRILPTNYEVKANWDGLERHLLECVEDPKRKLDPNAWFVFDRLSFAGDGAELDGERSTAQLHDVTEILKAYPTVTLKIGVYSDNAGAAAANRKLTEERAQAVKKELVRLGIAASRLDAKGYGSEHPICAANDTEECRRKNRRVAAHVTAK